MKKAREINIETDDLEYGRALARSLGIHYKGISVNVVAGGPGGEAVGAPSSIADRAPEDYILVSGRRIYKYMNVHAIAAEIEAAMSEAGGTEAGAHGLNGPHGESAADPVLSKAALLQERLTIGIVGMRGGCGVSSIAEGLARTFTLFHGRRVLLLTFSNFGPEYSSFIRPIDRLMYESEFLTDTDFEEQIHSYIMPDEYGVWQIGLRKGYNPLCVENAESAAKFIEKLTARLNIDLTIFDFGSAASMGTEKMRVLSKMDIAFAVLGRPEDRERAEEFARIVDNVSGGPGSAAGFGSEPGFKFTNPVLNDSLNILSESGQADNRARDLSGTTEAGDILFLGYSPESFKRAELDLGLEFGIGLEKIATNCEKYQTIS